MKRIIWFFGDRHPYPNAGFQRNPRIENRFSRLGHWKISPLVLRMARRSYRQVLSRHNVKSVIVNWISNGRVY